MSYLSPSFRFLWPSQQRVVPEYFSVLLYSKKQEQTFHLLLFFDRLPQTNTAYFQSISILEYSGLLSSSTSTLVRLGVTSCGTYFSRGGRFSYPPRPDRPPLPPRLPRSRLRSPRSPLSAERSRRQFFFTGFVEEITTRREGSSPMEEEVTPSIP